MSFEDQVITLRALLEREARQGSAGDGADIAIRRKERRVLKEQIEALEHQVCGLVKQFQCLPPLPDMKYIHWAQSVLALPTGCVFTVDMDTAFKETTILRIHLLDFFDTVLFDQVIAPGYVLSEHTMRTWGLTSSDMQGALPLSHVWDTLLEAVKGRYVVCYDLKRIHRFFEAYARHYDLEPLVLLGDCVLEHAMHYVPAAEVTGLGALCRLVGYSLPEPPSCTAHDRALGVLHVLCAMAQGVIAGECSVSHPWEDNDAQGDGLFV